jgi:hypothetical protein
VVAIQFQFSSKKQLAKPITKTAQVEPSAGDPSGERGEHRPVAAKDVALSYINQLKETARQR